MAPVLDGQEHVVRFSRSDRVGEFVLVDASPSGPKPLDLKLLATEGENPYAAEIKHSQVVRLRERKCQLTEVEWENVLKSVLLQRVDLIQDVAKNENFEATASINGSKMSIVFRKNISGITQRLGEIVLTENQDLELDTVSWTSIAVERSQVLGQQVLDLTAKYESAQQIIAKLNGQLEELVTAKKDHEDALLAKFRDLLNSKKLKIRDQQRLLAGATVDPKRAEAVQAARVSVRPRQPTTSRPGKRKGRSHVVNNNKGGPGSSDESDEEEEGFEPVSARRAASRRRSSNDDDDDEEDMEESKGTPEDPDSVTEDESDAPPDRGTTQADTTTNASETRASAGDEMQLDISSPPPTRELPFSSSSGVNRVEEDSGGAQEAAEPRKSREPVQQQQQEEADEESSDKTTDDDDEL